MDAAAQKRAGQLFPQCVRWGFLRENQTKSDKRNISPGVLTIESCDVFCLQQPCSLFWTLTVTSLQTIWKCVGNVFICVVCVSRFVLWGRVLCLWGWTDEAGMQTPFLCRQSPSRTVNDFSTSSGVMDNQDEKTGWLLLSYFFNGRRQEEKVPTSLRSCCAAHVFPFGCYR